MPLDAGDFSLIDRRVVDALNALPENNRFIRGLRAWVGFKQTGVPYVRPERMFGRTTNSLLNNIGWARKGILSFSYAPLDLITALALVTVGLALLGIVFSSGQPHFHAGSSAQGCDHTDRSHSFPRGHPAPVLEHHRFLSGPHLRRGEENARRSSWTASSTIPGRRSRWRPARLTNVNSSQLIPTRCAVCGTTDAAREVYPANFSLEDLNPAVFSARRMPDRVHYRMVRCLKCGLLRSDPVANEETLASLYSESTLDYSDEISNLRLTYGRFLSRLLAYVSKPAALLEIGCGNGFALEEALLRGFSKVHGGGAQPHSRCRGAGRHRVQHRLRHDAPGSIRRRRI